MARVVDASVSSSEVMLSSVSASAPLVVSSAELLVELSDSTTLDGFATGAAGAAGVSAGAAAGAEDESVLTTSVLVRAFFLAALRSSFSFASASSF